MSAGAKLLRRAIEAGVRRDYRLAERLLEELIAEGDGGPEALLYLGRARHALGDHGRALLAFRDYLAIRPSSIAGRLFAGRSLLALGYPRRAERLFREALRKRPEDPTLLGLIGIACLKGRRSAEAVAVLERAVAAAPEDRRIYRAYLNALLVRGVRLARNEDDDEARALAAGMLAFVAENGLDCVLARLTLGRIESERERHEEALEHYERAAELAPDDESIRWYRVSALMALGRDRDAVAEIQTLSGGADAPEELRWTGELVDLQLARTLTASGEAERAAAACHAFIKRWGEGASVHGMYAENLRSLGRLEAAENHARRAIALERSEPALRYALLMILYERESWEALRRELASARRLGCDEDALLRVEALMAARSDEDPRRAVALAQEAIRRTGPAPALMEALAVSYARVGLPDLAVPWYRKAMSVDGPSAGILRELAAALRSLAADGVEGAVDDLAAILGEYLALAPEDAEIRRELLRLSSDAGDWRAVLDQTRILLENEAGNATLRRIAAQALRKLGRYREAAVQLRTLLREKPLDGELALSLAYCLERMGSGAIAAELLSRAAAAAAAAKPKNAPPRGKIAELRMAAGTILFRLKKTEAAIKAYSEAAALAPEDPRPYRNLAKAYRALGVEEQALRYENGATEIEERRQAHRGGKR